MSRAALIITKGSFALDEFLWIFLATNSLPVPVGPEIRTLLSEVDNFSIIFFIRVIEGLLPIKSNEWKSLFSIISGECDEKNTVSLSNALVKSSSYFFGSKTSSIFVSLYKQLYVNCLFLWASSFLAIYFANSSLTFVCLV